jgi:cbb3-type cytochrome oxidase maturation protein
LVEQDLRALVHVSVIYVVLPVAIVIAAVAVWGFLWAVRRGQFDDLRTPALRALQDDGERMLGGSDAPPRGSPSPKNPSAS